MEWIQPSPPPNDRAQWLAAMVELMRRAVEAAPEKPRMWERLGAAQLDAGEAAAGEATLREGLNRWPGEPRLSLQLARAAVSRGAFEQALVLVESALTGVACDALPAASMRELVLLRFTLFYRLGRFDDAERALPALFAMREAPPTLFHFGVARARRTGDWTRLLELCDAVLAYAPGSTGARYYRALALLRLGQPTEASIHPQTFLSVAPLGDASNEAFLSIVRAEILSNPTLAPDPRGFTTTHGMQTTQLVQPGDVALPTLCSLLQAAVDRYDRQLAGLNSEDPFVRHRPSKVKLTPWAVVYPGEGRQRSHIHPPGWLSGVFYVSAPPGGELLLGAMDEEDAPELPWSIETIQPTAGTLVLFPSFIPHATRATHADELRICVAFDVVPV